MTRTYNLPPRWLDVVDAVCRLHLVYRREVLSDSHQERTSACRQEVWWVLRRKFNASYPTIGWRFGGRHHTTILHGVRAHCARMGLPSPSVSKGRKSPTYTAVEIETIRAMYAAGKSDKVIARALPGRSPVAITKQRSLQGLVKHRRACGHANAN